MPDSVRPLHFDPDSQEGLEDREFFEGTNRTVRTIAPLARKGNQARRTNALHNEDRPNFARIERSEFINRRGRLEDGFLFPKQELQWVDENANVRHETVNRVYESNSGRFISSSADAGARCQNRKLLGGTCGAWIHMEELKGGRSLCVICGVCLCRKHVHIEDGLPFCRKHRGSSALVIANNSLAQEARRHSLTRSGAGLVGRILRDTFTVPEDGPK